jgi:hypothetical protein
MIILKSIYNFFKQMRRAHAAAAMARNGDHKGAQRLMMEDFRGWI